MAKCKIYKICRFQLVPSPCVKFSNGMETLHKLFTNQCRLAIWSRNYNKCNRDLQWRMAVANNILVVPSKHQHYFYGPINHSDFGWKRKLFTTHTTKSGVKLISAGSSLVSNPITNNVSGRHLNLMFYKELGKLTLNLNEQLQCIANANDCAI